MALLRSAGEVRLGLRAVKELFEENVSYLRETHDEREPSASTPLDGYFRRPPPRKRRTSHQRHASLSTAVEVDVLPTKLNSLANELHQFGEVSCCSSKAAKFEYPTSPQCLEEIPEFKDEAVDLSIRNFEGDLQYWAHNMGEDFKGTYR